MDLDLKVGVVSAVDEANTSVKVFFPDADNMVSDWLYVLQSGGEVEEKALTTDKAGKHSHTNSHTHTVEVAEASVSLQTAGAHEHTVDVEGTAGTAAEAGDHTHTADAHTHTATAGSSTENTGEAGEHQHTIPKHTHTVKKWMPKVNDKVRCIMYAGDEETDGFVLGAIK